jgi:hypothetical protein
MNVSKRPLVAPRAGEWIETFVKLTIAPTEKVAPRSGAWIEYLGSINI